MATPDTSPADSPDRRGSEQQERNELIAEQNERISELRSELEYRDAKLATQPDIEQAKGMLRQDFGLDDDEAFRALSRLSQETNHKLRDVAARVVGVLSGTVSAETARVSLRELSELREHLRTSHG